jgi:Tricorn protease C1 domain
MVQHAILGCIAAYCLIEAAAFVPQAPIAKLSTSACLTPGARAHAFLQPACCKSVRYNVHSKCSMSAANWASSFKSAAAAALAAMQVLSIGSPLMPMLAPLPAVAAVAEVAQAPAAAVHGPFEETWDFINRFYVDRTYNGNDWAAVHTKYSQLVKSGKLSDTVAAEKVCAHAYIHTCK